MIKSEINITWDSNENEALNEGMSHAKISAKNVDTHEAKHIITGLLLSLCDEDYGKMLDFIFHHILFSHTVTVFKDGDHRDD